MCPLSGELRCSDADEALALVCSAGAWAESERCGEGARCDPRAGATLGQCVAFVTECRDRAPGAAFCRGNDRMTCDAERLSADAVACPMGEVCVLEGDRTRCAPDTDECMRGEDDCDDDPDACSNTFGGFECVCPAGYMGAGRGEGGCADIDECGSGERICDTSPTATCNEVIGGPSTCTCPPGYSGSGGGANGCVDRDECEDGAEAACGAGATDCTNTGGGYLCACDPSFALREDGQPCLPRWGAPVLLEQDTGNVASPAVGLDEEATAIAVWRQMTGATYRVFVNRGAAGSDWDGAQQIHAAGSGAVEDAPALAVDGDGSAVAVWAEMVGVNSIWASRYAAGGAWSDPVLLETEDNGQARNPAVDIDGAGNAIAVWNQSDGSRQVARANRFASDAWSGPVPIDTNAGTSQFVKVALDGAGNGLAVWWQGSPAHIWANRYAPGTGWATAGRIDSEAGQATQPKITVDDVNNGLAVWEQATGTSVDIWANRGTVTSTFWNGAERIETDDAGDAHAPAVASNGAGAGIAVWHQSDGTRT